MGFKLGPALKLNNYLDKFRQQTGVNKYIIGKNADEKAEQHQIQQQQQQQ